MSWPLLFIRLLLASTLRTDDEGPSTEYIELRCRMLGETPAYNTPQCVRWRWEGCGCPIDWPRYEPTWDANAHRVGWTQSQGPSTAITYSFEKEWLGVVPDLYKLYQPGGRFCQELWERVSDEEKQEFMAEFHSAVRYDAASGGVDNPALAKYMFPFSEHNPCGLQVDDMHTYLPLVRSSQAPKSISGLIESDHGPWEIKADSFYYHLDTMETDARQALGHLDVPQSETSEGFPAERRIQLHVVAPLDQNAYDNQLLRRNFRLIQLYFSDYMFLRLAFPSGPEGKNCNTGGHEFHCDIFTDDWNLPIDDEDGRAAASDSQPEEPEKYRKFQIVGIRGSDTYGKSEEIHRVGFEIRKSQSFASALTTAEAITLAIKSMTLNGTARVGMTQERPIDTVRDFAKEHRMKLKRGPFCDSPASVPWQRTVDTLASYLYLTVGKKPEPTSEEAEIDVKVKLRLMLRLLLCTDWTELLGDVNTRRTREAIMEEVQTTCLRVANAGGAKWDPDELRKVRDEMDPLRVMLAEYAFDLSKHF